MAKTFYNLPEKVIFCKKCCVSNQRPNSSPEFKKKDATIDTVGFKDGICDACRYFEFKKTIDWKAREKELADLCDRFRKKDGTYDVIVPGSGGKDSFFVSHLLKEKYKMNPLTITWAPTMYTDIGWKNLQNWVRSGFDNILVTPNGKVHSTLVKYAFLNLLNPFQPFILGQRTIGAKFALKYNVKLVMYGENQAEAHNKIEETLNPKLDPRHFTVKKFDKENIYLSGLSLKELKENNINEKDLNQYVPIKEDEFLNSRTELYYMSYFKNWSPQSNFYYAKENGKFESNFDRSEGTYTKHSSLDDKTDGQHYYTMYIKFGQGRAMNDVNRDIRDGFLTREEGVALMRKYDGEFPKKYFKDFLEYIDISEQEYWQKIDDSRPPHLWEKKGNTWKLIHQIT